MDGLLIGLPPPEPAPYKPELLAKVKLLGADNRNDPGVSCRLPGPTRATSAPFPLEMVQTPSKLVVLFETMHAYRIVPIGAGHPNDLEPSYMGDSAAHWEGDTLVVDVTGFNDKTWLAGPGTFHSEDLHIVERYTRQENNTILYDAIAEDPQVFTKPWHMMRFPLRHAPPGDRVMEYECIDLDFQHLQAPTAKP